LCRQTPPKTILAAGRQVTSFSLDEWRHAANESELVKEKPTTGYKKLPMETAA